jgi:hypothetical protein
LTAYSTCLRKAVKWYRKLAVEICNNWNNSHERISTSPGNNKKENISLFKEAIASKLLELNDSTKVVPDTPESDQQISNHVLKATEKRRYCYETFSKIDGSKSARAKVKQNVYLCDKCNKNYCIPCFLRYPTTE